MTALKTALPLILTLLASPAAAGEAACRFENGAVLVPATVGEVSGDYILDPSTAHSQLHETRAQEAGFDATDLVLPVRLADINLAAVPITVVDLDSRSAGFDTPVAGVIGADILAGRVMDLELAPCRFGLHAAGSAPPFHASLTLVVRDAGGVPAVEAGVSDGTRSGIGLFAIDTGSAAAVRLSDRLAVAAPPLADPQARHLARGRLRALSFAGGLIQAAPAGLAGDLGPDLSGTLGNGVWAHWRLRLDLARGRLMLAPISKRPGVSPGP